MTVTAHRGQVLHFLDDPHCAGDESRAYFSDGLLVTEEGRVTALGHARDLLGALPGDARIHEHGRGLLVPGMVDCHVHYPQVEVMACYGTRLIDWLRNHTFPVEARFHDPVHAGEVARFFLGELLRNGTTTALVFGTVHPQSVDAFFEAARERNLRMMCGKVLMDRNAPEALLDTPASGYEQSRELIRRWHNVARLQYAVTPRFAPTSSAQQLELAGKLVDEFPGVYLHTHVAENREECDWVAELFPEREDYLDVYDHFGLLGRRSVLAHGIHLSRREWSRLATTGASIACCPTSNLFIGSGLFNQRQADESGVRVALGTDVGGGDSFSMLRTINEAYKVQQLQGFNLSPMRAMYMATLGGARALDLDGVIGNFEPGKEADFVVLDLAATPLMEFRLSRCRDLEQVLFALQMLGDDRVVAQTWVMGECVHARSG